MKQNLLKKKTMEIDKAKVVIVPSGLGRDNRIRRSTGTRNFKVYSENEFSEIDSRTRKSMPVTKGSTLASTSSRKAVSKSLETSKGKNDSSAKSNLRRRPLADVSNISSISSRNLVRISSKPSKFMPATKGSTFASTSSQKVVLKSMETRKGKNDTSAKSNFGRPSADVSNVNSTSSRNLLSNSSKPSVSASVGSRTVNISSRKSFQGGLSQGGSGYHTSKKVLVKDLKVPSGYQRIKVTGQAHGSLVDTNGRRTTRTSLIPTRKSFSVSKREDQTDILEENSGSSGKINEIKFKVGRKIVPRLSNSRTHHWKNRVSDGFIIMGQRTMDSRTLSRNSFRPIVKTAVKTSDAKTNTIPNLTRDSEKNAMVTTTVSKNMEGAASSLPENITQESINVQLPSDGDCKPSTSDIIITKKSSRRRKSYTSLLMEGSKLLEEHHDVLKQEKLPDMDDERNQLEVVDYVDDIYQYYWVTETQNPPPANYMSIQIKITPHMRAVLINWLIEVHLKFDLMQETLYLTITLLDRYLSQVTIEKNEMQLVGLTALLLASKYEDSWQWIPRVKDLLSISAESYTREQMLEMEKLILKKLKFRLNTPTPYVFMLRFLKAAQSDAKLEHLAFYLIELCLVEYEALMFKPSLLCASAIYVARCTLKMAPHWTPLLCQHARYEVSQLRECSEMLLRFQRAARVGQLQVIYEKYMRPERSGAAALKPLDKLPL
ncbi:putative cyclin-B3-1 [Humulus lupulus]|uniref:putative cyclin-B3-1 n=1 Tax=Humulus lupulus TaxID=3486 RepID=UPI002B40B4D7|nr:putative cyclin-B3-1 [Humulus lupulus]